MSESVSQPHEQAFEEFGERAMKSVGDSIHEVILYGSTARGETRGIDSDVDVLVVVNDEDHDERLRDIAYAVMLEYGVVVSLNIKDKGRFESRKDHPFIKNVLDEGRSYG